MTRHVVISWGWFMMSSRPYPENDDKLIKIAVVLASHNIDIRPIYETNVTKKRRMAGSLSPDIRSPPFYQLFLPSPMMLLKYNNVIIMRLMPWAMRLVLWRRDSHRDRTLITYIDNIFLFTFFFLFYTRNNWIEDNEWIFFFSYQWYFIFFLFFFCFLYFFKKNGIISHFPNRIILSSLFAGIHLLMVDQMSILRWKHKSFALSAMSFRSEDVWGILTIANLSDSNLQTLLSSTCPPHRLCCLRN